MQVPYPIFEAIAAVLLQVSSAENMTTPNIGSTGGESETEERSSWMFNSGRIIGGKSATEGQFPWMAALFQDNEFKCSASIIGPRTILTAAHCVVDNGVAISAESFHAIANYSRSADEVRIDFESVIPHPNYNYSMDIHNDIAILTTTAPIAFSDNVQLISIASSDTSTRNNKKVTAMGWGFTQPGNPESETDKLQYVKLAIVPNSLCRKFYRLSSVGKRKICAGGKLGICSGDSGGPLVQFSAGKPIQIGITSYIHASYGCGSEAPGVFTRVSSYSDFISQRQIRPLRTEARGGCPRKHE